MRTRTPTPAVACIEIAPLLKYALTPTAADYRIAEVFLQLDRLAELRKSFGREISGGFRRDLVRRAP